MSKYIEINFMGASDTGKTGLWEVRNIRDNVPIGIIRWAGNWRKYVFEQQGSIYYDWDCLRQIADFIEQTTKDHYAGKALSA